MYSSIRELDMAVIVPHGRRPYQTLAVTALTMTAWTSCPTSDSFLIARRTFIEGHHVSSEIHDQESEARV